MEAWADGDTYEPFVGRWSRLVAREFVDRLHPPEGLRWLDVGCGTGALTETVLSRAAPAAVVGVEPSTGFVAHAQQRVTDLRASFCAGDAQALPVADASFDVVVSGLVLNFVPDRLRGLAEMRRAVVPGGVVAAYVWDYPGDMHLLRLVWDAAVRLDPAARAAHEGVRFAFCRPDPLRELFTAAGLVDVTVEPVVVATVFADADDFWSPFLIGQAPAQAYVRSLSSEARRALRDEVLAEVPVDADGSIPLTARAWAVRAVSPG